MWIGQAGRIKAIEANLARIKDADLAKLKEELTSFRIEYLNRHTEMKDMRLEMAQMEIRLTTLMQNFKDALRESVDNKLASYVTQTECKYKHVAGQ